MTTQADLVLDFLKSGKGITPRIALNKFGIFRLADVVFKLRGKGNDITTELIELESGKRYALYHLITKPAFVPLCVRIEGMADATTRAQL